MIPVVNTLRTSLLMQILISAAGTRFLSSSCFSGKRFLSLLINNGSLPLCSLESSGVIGIPTGQTGTSLARVLRGHQDIAAAQETSLTKGIATLPVKFKINQKILL